MLTTVTVEVGRGEFGFSAAHAGLHDGELESLHGHTFQVTLRLLGTPGNDGMLIDFGEIKAGLWEAIAPLRGRTMVPGHAPEVLITSENNKDDVLRNHLHMPDSPGDAFADLDHLTGTETFSRLYERYERDRAAQRLACYRALLE